MPDDKVNRLRFDDEFLLSSAEKRFTEGDYFGALTVLNRRESLHEPLADAYAVYADVYEALELWHMAADSWFRFLDTCNEADFGEGYEGLGVAFMNMGNEFQSAFYYHRAFFEDGSADPAEFEAVLNSSQERPRLRLVHEEGKPDENPEQFAMGLAHLKAGDLEGAKEIFAEIPEESRDYPSAAGLSAMCTLMLGDDEDAERECAALLEKHGDNVQVLTTYCAVLGARENREEARKTAEKLAALPVDTTDDLYRIATALCETGLHAEAYEKLTLLKKRLPYDENILWFFAASAHRLGKPDEAIEALETLTTVYPRKAVAQWYLTRLREIREEGGEVEIPYYYRLPEKKYREIATFLLKVNNEETEIAEEIVSSDEFAEYFHLAFDEMEGRDEKMQLLAAKLAVKCHADSLLRAVLIDCDGEESVKLSILHDLVCRNEDNSFGTVICNIYKEFFMHQLDIGRKRGGAFMQAFADVYVKFAFLDDANEGKICAAGEDIYHALAEAEAWDYFGERAALAAAIYREARLTGGEHSFEAVCGIFGANRIVAQRILDFMM